MFTGIVQDQCEVLAKKVTDGICALTVDLGEHAAGLQLGASVANNGACLTAAHIDGTVVRFDVIAETMALTNLSDVAVGDRVNIERSLKFGDELGGHILSGHVSGTATVADIEVDGNNRTMWFDVEPEHMQNLLWKGWISLDGASLTISRVDRDANRIAVSLIPETLERTTLGRAKLGDRINIEIDAQTQTIIHAVHELFRDETMRAQVLGQA